MLENLPLISIVMVDGSFRESFHSLDYFGKQTLLPVQYELIWVEYYDRVNPVLAEAIARYPNFRVITLNRTGLYHSSYCFNAGIQASRGAVLVIPDADVVVEEDFLETVWQEHQKNEELVMYSYRYDQAKATYRPDWDIAYLRQVCTSPNPYNWGPCLSVRAKWLRQINGYEQHSSFASGFHLNAQDVYTRLKNTGLYVKWHPKIRLYHPWHPQTGSGAYAYDVQRLVIDYRARHLETLAYEGIDASRNLSPSAELLERVQTIVRQTNKRNGGLVDKLSFYLGALNHYIRSYITYHRNRPHLPKGFGSIREPH